MSSYVVGRPAPGATALFIEGDEAHHAVRVARRRVGDLVTLIDGAGSAWDAEILELTADRVRCGILSERPGMGEPSVDLALAAPLIKADRFEMLIEKGVELGVSSFLPFESEHTEARLPSEGKRRRWDMIARSATKQCLRSRIPEIRPPGTLDDVIAVVPSYDCVALAWEAEGTGTVAALPVAGAGRVMAIVGPEGGLHPSEADRFIAAGARAVSLGARRLRAETAAITLVASLMHAAGEYDGPAYGA